MSGMMAPIPKELEDFLVELSECGSVIYQDHLEDKDEEKVQKLKLLGLVEEAIVLTPAGKERLARLKQENR